MSSTKPSAQESARTGVRQRNREYDAPWKQEIIADSMISGLLYQVSKQLTWVADADIKGVGAFKSDKLCDAGRPGSLSARCARSTAKAENEGALARLRSALCSRFGSLSSAFRTLDENGDGTLTFGELQSGLSKYRVLGQRACVLQELRMAFNGMDPDRRGVLRLKDWVRGTAEDDVARAPSRSEESVVDQIAVSSPVRPMWSHRQPKMSPIPALSLFDRHEKEHPLPVPVKKDLPNYFPMPPHYGVLERSDIFLEKRQELQTRSPNAEQREFATHCRFKPEMSPKSLTMTKRMGGPMGERGTTAEAKNKQKVTEGFVSQAAKEVAACTFQPAILRRSARHFGQLVDDGQQWHDRLYGRSLQPTPRDRMLLRRKKVTKDVEATFHRERVPRISEESKRRARSAGARLDAHTRLHMNIPRGRDDHPEGEGADFAVTVRQTRSVSFLYRAPNKGQEAGDEAATTVAESPRSGARRPGETLSPRSSPGGGAHEGSASSRSSSRASVDRLSTTQVQQARHGRRHSAHRLVASAEITDLLHALGPSARPLDD